MSAASIPIPEAHRPDRASDVAAWIKATRDGYYPHTDPWTALDELLDDYRERADTGRSLR